MAIATRYLNKPDFKDNSDKIDLPLYTMQCSMAS